MTIIRTTYPWKPYEQLSLDELRAEHAEFVALRERTSVASARRTVANVVAILAAGIKRREEEGVAA